MPNPILLPGAPEGLAAARLRNVDTFLATRGLDRVGLDKLVRARTGDARHLLLTSSPVQGLANSTSDIDLVRIEDDAIEGARMATQIFEQDQHLEAISYGAPEVDAALADLAAAAELDPAGVSEAHRRWDKGHELRRKYLERIVNGVSLDGTSPYLDHLPPLARMWKWASLHTAVRQVFHLRLAEAAGETRGSAGYALGALLHLMDAVLSHTGDVYSNRKWYLLRWQRFLAGGAVGGAMGGMASGVAGGAASGMSGSAAGGATGGTGPAALGERFAECDRRLTDALRGGAGGALAGELSTALAEVFALAGEGHAPALVLQPTADLPQLAFLPGAQMLVGRTALFPGTGPLPTGRIDVTPDAEPPGDPAGILRACRAGALQLLPA
jgi:hypothetical protein